MLRALRVPIGWAGLFRRTASEMVADNCLSLAASLAYYFFLALFPALLFLVAVMSFFPVEHLLVKEQQGIESLVLRADSHVALNHKVT